MCGITGIYNLIDSPIRPEEITRQIETIVHRGPNQGSIYVSKRHNCGLGVRRLSIIDVAGGNQPLSNEDNTIYLVYNGETYNHQALRAELERLDHRPKTHSDAEALLHGYEAWGPAGVLQKLRGMFAVALWDEKRQQLFLARDRFGIKPLYYAEHGGRLYFASEIKAILTEPAFPRQVNLSALQAMLTLGFVPGPATMFEGIYKLPPAHFLIAKNGVFQINKYWQLDYAESSVISEHEATEQFLTLLRESVQLRLMSEVPVGALLSGGLDSGSLVTLMQAEMDTRLKTVSIGFEQADYDESPLSGKLAHFIGTEHHTLSLTPADFEDYPVVMDHLEEPQCGATALPIYKLYQACRQAGLTVVLTGEGADELLGGYFWYKGDARARPLLALPGMLRRLITVLPVSMSTAAGRVLRHGAWDAAARYQDWLAVGGQGFRQRVFSNDVSHILEQKGENPLLANWVEKLSGLKTKAPLHQFMWLETQTRLPDFINFEVDKMSMAGSIEARVPFLDHKLWEFCASLPPQYKLKGNTEKYLLRQAVRGLLPETTRTRRKMGLASPYAYWLKAKRLPDWAETVLSPEAIQQADLFNPLVVDQLRRAHQSGQPYLAPILMGVLSTQLWFDYFIN